MPNFEFYSGLENFMQSQNEKNCETLRNTNALINQMSKQPQ